MLVTRLVTSTATPTSLLDLLGIDTGRRSVAAIKMNLASGAVSWGTSAEQPMTVVAAGDVLPLNSLKDVYLVGAGTVNVAVFYHA